MQRRKNNYPFCEDSKLILVKYLFRKAFHFYRECFYLQDSAGLLVSFEFYLAARLGSWYLQLDVFLIELIVFLSLNYFDYGIIKTIKDICTGSNKFH